MYSSSKRTVSLALAILFLALAQSGCSRSQPSQPTVQTPVPDPVPEGPVWFEDVTDAVGLNFTHEAGPTDNYFLPSIIGSGGACFDFNGDGLLDIYLVQNGGPKSKSSNRLFQQQPNHTFKDVTEGSGLGVAGWGMGVAIGDVNNDGKPDVLLTEYVGIKLFINLGGGKFDDVTQEAGSINPLWGTAAAFFDYDRDGLLDLVVVNYVGYDPGFECMEANRRKDYCPPSSYRFHASRLFRNVGPQAAAEGKPAARVRFTDVSVETEIAKLPGPGLGVAIADFNGDGWPDIFVANDGQPNRLWINQQGKRFADEAPIRNVALTFMGDSFAGMGVAIGDIDNDGLLDLYVSHLTNETNTLWKQTERGAFRDVTSEWGLTTTKWRGTGFGTLMADFDQDGFADVAVVNGRVTRGGGGTNTGLAPFWEPYAERNQLLANTGRGRFTDISASNVPFCGYHNVGRGLICADFDNDGAMDLLVTSIGGKARLFKNVAPNRGHWLKIVAIDPRYKREAIGAEFVVKAGERSWIRTLSPFDSYLASSSSVVHIGLGPIDRITAIEVRWPDGLKETFSGGAVDRQIELIRGSVKDK